MFQCFATEACMNPSCGGTTTNSTGTNSTGTTTTINPGDPLCPLTSPQDPTMGSLNCTADQEAIQCFYGQETCCNQTFASTMVCIVEPALLRLRESSSPPCARACVFFFLCIQKCRCINGLFLCFDTQACLDPPCAVCPSESPLNPLSPSDCTNEAEGLVCLYGQETCCNQTLARVNVSCGHAFFF